MASIEFAGERVTSQGRGVFKISKWRLARMSSSWTRGLTSQGRGTIFKFSKWRRAHFVLTPPGRCLRYFGRASPPRNLRTRAGIVAQARPRPIRENSNRVFDDDF